MSKKKKINLPDEHHAVRFIKNVDLRRDESGNVIGVNATAFRLRPKENYLSASYLESAGNSRAVALAALRKVFEAKWSRISKAALAIGNVAAIKDTCSSKAKVKIANEPKPWNKHYAALRQYPDDAEISERLAVQAWADLTRISDC